MALSGVSADVVGPAVYVYAPLVDLLLRTPLISLTNPYLSRQDWCQQTKVHTFPCADLFRQALPNSNTMQDGRWASSIHCVVYDHIRPQGLAISALSPELGHHHMYSLDKVARCSPYGADFGFPHILGSYGAISDASNSDTAGLRVQLLN